MTQPVFRFAPSPNGRLHLGHAASALLNETLARRLGGRLLLRIEDIDVTRCRPEYEAAIVADLAWLGIAFDPGFRRQSEHFAEYRAAADRLSAMGLLYPCFRTRREIADDAAAFEAASGAPAPRDPDGAILRSRALHGHDEAEAARRMAAGEPHTLRLDMARAMALAGDGLAYIRFDPSGREERVPADPARWGDAVIVRKEIPTSYHLSVVHDDALQGVTHVARGADLEAATDLHALLQRLLGLPTPRYLHHPLVLDEGGEKLAKSRGSTPLAELRAAGLGPDDARRLARVAV
ncbi:MAG: tRNA glutamyl-Q(34) synthetase GluQRS [Microvirga sp.]|nr:tRNA glutamyl-Q(34) synthetase GluQRS [Microvirga sp.]